MRGADALRARVVEASQYSVTWARSPAMCYSGSGVGICGLTKCGGVSTMSESGRVGPAGSAQELFGRRLRRLRERHRLTQQALGRKVPISQGRIAQFENGKELPSEDVARRLDEVLGADEELVEIWGLAGQLRYPALAETYREAEGKAARIYHFANIIPGLAQTEDYARAIFTQGNELFGGIDVEQRVKQRCTRQSVLDEPNPPWVWSILDEIALRRVVGGDAVMRTQLLHLLNLGSRPHITFQVLPARQPIPGGLTSTILSLLTLRDGRQLAYQESGLTSSFATSHEEVALYTTFYDHAQSRALPPAESTEFIRALIEEHYRDDPQP
ncbi:transcriptional regulator [Streptomyces griseocarneus]|nr:transcriptional regulator [Streptomyces griseocarneus]